MAHGFYDSEYESLIAIIRSNINFLINDINNKESQLLFLKSKQRILERRFRKYNAERESEKH